MKSLFVLKANDAVSKRLRSSVTKTLAERQKRFPDLESASRTRVSSRPRDLSRLEVVSFIVLHRQFQGMGVPFFSFAMGSGRKLWNWYKRIRPTEASGAR